MTAPRKRSSNTRVPAPAATSTYAAAVPIKLRSALRVLGTVATGAVDVFIHSWVPSTNLQAKQLCLFAFTHEAGRLLRLSQPSSLFFSVTAHHVTVIVTKINFWDFFFFHVHFLISFLYAASHPSWPLSPPSLRTFFSTPPPPPFLL